MSNIPSELKYATSHEWVRVDSDGIATVGISEHAQGLLGDMVFVELPDVDDSISAGDDVAVAESVKAASDIYAPVSGTVVAINEALEDAPELLNSDAFGEGWLFQVKLDDVSELENLLDAEGYKNSIDED
ncbi:MULTISPECIES: glycine cleavage system protein GcvH [Colwellia]|jgi:glycine cleavage system H protein|uniref:Glycine cleavage system H protein n=1 Tax=Colwellia psychrerythraea (strain 34H / ATCC BAA-681) TaxID=167879 RepID=Q486J7_COLP3|nr:MULTISPECIES: glycine cleavage system protein GcvH [Colwellia]AAZ26949.1 glycine cleavage system H protein [Colwellia psychrerythraea 34H]PKH89234.1 glycine cleavage system protein H [Colwellia sp. Bg11-28]